MGRIRFKPSITLNNNFEDSHYQGARSFFYTINKMGLDEEDYGEAVNQMKKEIRGRYGEVKKFIEDKIEEHDGPADEKARLIRDSVSFTEERFMELVDLAEEDHKQGSGVSEYRSSWR